MTRGEARRRSPLQWGSGGRLRPWEANCSEMLWNAFWASQIFNFVQWSEWNGGQININLHFFLTLILHWVCCLWHYSYSWSVKQITTYFENHSCKVNYRRSFACNGNSSLYIICGYCHSIDFDNFLRSLVNPIVVIQVGHLTGKEVTSDGQNTPNWPNCN